MLIGYAVSGEPTLKAYYERLQPFAPAFMGLFGRSQLPHRATLSRFLAALDEPFVEALRSVFLHDALARLGPEADVGGLWDRLGTRWRSEEHTSELQSPDHLVCRLLLEKKKKKIIIRNVSIRVTTV